MARSQGVGPGGAFVPKGRHNRAHLANCIAAREPSTTRSGSSGGTASFPSELGPKKGHGAFVFAMVALGLAALQISTFATTAVVVFAQPRAMEDNTKD